MYEIQILVNKRLDEWVVEERLDPSKVYFPKKVQPSRPSSPVAGDVAPSIPLANAAPAVMKKKYKKRPLLMSTTAGEEVLDKSMSIVIFPCLEL